MKKLADGKNNPHIWKTQATCTGAGWDQEGKTPCYSLWEVTAMDIRSRTHTDYDGSSETYYGFVCPDCGCFTELNTEDIPYDVRSKATKYVENLGNEEI